MRRFKFFFLRIVSKSFYCLCTEISIKHICSCQEYFTRVDGNHCRWRADVLDPCEAWDVPFKVITIDPCHSHLSLSGSQWICYNTLLVSTRYVCHNQDLNSKFYNALRKTTHFVFKVRQIYDHVNAFCFKLRWYQAYLRTLNKHDMTFHLIKSFISDSILYYRFIRQAWEIKVVLSHTKFWRKKTALLLSVLFICSSVLLANLVYFSNYLQW